MRARSIAEWLLLSYGVPNERFSRLTTGWCRPTIFMRMSHYRAWLDRVEWAELTAAERRVVRRFDVLYCALRQGAGWEQALSTALTAEPFDPDDPAERTVGV